VLSTASAARAGMPYCALRDPTSQIFAMYPEASDYRSLVRSIDSSVRSEVQERVGFDLSAREVGRHTLYVALRETRPLGLVHVRSELSDWGLIEVAWALDLDLRIQDFRIQRCRGEACRALATDSALHDALRNRGLDDLNAWLKYPNRAQPAVIGVDPKMVQTLIRSAAKTVAVTGLAWQSELRALAAR
jgi:hypothetical protein